MPRKLTPAERARQETRVLQLRRARWTWQSISDDMGLGLARCHEIYEQALAGHPLSAIQVDEHRLEETELIDAAVRDLLQIATGETGTSARTRVEAWSSIRAWAERKAKLLGLDAPSRTEVVTIDALDAEIARLETELAGRAALSEAAQTP